MFRSIPLAALAAAALLAGNAQAATSFDLRALNGYRNWVGNADPETAAQGINDRFNNGNLLTGTPYTGGLTTPAALYSVIGGATYAVQAYRLRLQDPTQGSFFNSSQTQFMGEAYFGFVNPLVDERYGVRFSDNNGASFDDVITLDVVRLNSGEAGVQIRRLAGTASNITVSGVQTVTLLSFLAPGKTLADVNLIDLRLFWEPSGAGGNVVRGRIELITVQNGVPTGLAGSTTLSNTFDIFRGEATTSFQVGASWAPLAAVPESGSWALMAGGIAVLAARQRRTARR